MGKYTKTNPIFFINIREINGFKERKCTKCQEWKPETIEYFYMNNKSKPEKGFKAECKQCSIKLSRERWLKIPAEERKEKKKIIDKQYWDSKPEVKQRNQAKNKRLRENGYYKEYQQSNPEKMKKYNERRFHKIHEISEEEWNSCKQYFNNSCAYCGMSEEEHRQRYKERLHKEHVVHDGSKYLDNCIPACKSCNSKKWKFLLEDWYKENNPDCIGYSKERLIRIYKWLNEDYKKYIKIKI